MASDSCKSIVVTVVVVLAFATFVPGMRAVISLWRPKDVVQPSDLSFGLLVLSTD